MLVAETAPRPQVRRGQQPPRIGVLRTPINLRGVAGLHDHAIGHDHYPLRHVADNGEVMRDKQEAQAEVALHSAQQVEDLRLDREVERTYWLVANDKARRSDKPRAMAILCRCPPENWFGYRDALTDQRLRAAMTSASCARKKAGPLSRAGLYYLGVNTPPSGGHRSPRGTTAQALCCNRWLVECQG